MQSQTGTHQERQTPITAPAVSDFDFIEALLDTQKLQRFAIDVFMSDVSTLLRLQL